MKSNMTQKMCTNNLLVWQLHSTHVESVWIYSVKIINLKLIAIIKSNIQSVSNVAFLFDKIKV